MIVDLDLEFQQDDPFRADDYGRMSLGSRAVDLAWPKQHGRHGHHDGALYEKAALHLTAIGGPLHELYKAGIDSWSAGSGVVEIVLATTFGRVDDWTIIASAYIINPPSPPRRLIIPEVLDGKTAGKGYVTLPTSFSGIMHIRVVGRRVRV